MLELPRVDDDGLPSIEVKPHSLQKHLLIWHYARQFSTGMKKKWGHRVYIDLFAGPGHGQLVGESTFVKGSPLLALDVPDPFDRYIFCERDPGSMAALRSRANGSCPSGSHLEFIDGDVNDAAARVHEAIPRGRRGSTVLALCIADPYKVANLAFETLRTLSTDRFIDIGVLIPTGMEIQRNIDTTLQTSVDLDRFLGSTEWRNSWSQAKARNISAREWSRDFFGDRMRDLGFLYDPTSGQVKPVLAGGNVKYDFVIFSRSDLGVKFARDAKLGTDPQRPLFGN